MKRKPLMPTSYRDPTSVKRVEDTCLTKIVLYHSTTHENAANILCEGFRDRTDHYMTENLHTGVWLSDTPLDENEGACSEALLCVELDAMVVTPYEWVEDGKGYREFLVPATIVNRVPCRRR
jgi:hypothetical protein